MEGIFFRANFWAGLAAGNLLLAGYSPILYQKAGAKTHQKFGSSHKNQQK